MKLKDEKKRMATKIEKLKAALKETTAAYNEEMLVRHTHTHTHTHYIYVWRYIHWLCYVRSEVERYREERNIFREKYLYLKEKHAQLVAQLDGGKYLHHTPTTYHTLLLSSYTHYISHTPSLIIHPLHITHSFSHHTPSARMRSEGYCSCVCVCVCVCVCLLLYISPLECLFVSKTIPST